MKRRQFILSLAGTAAAGLTGWQLSRAVRAGRLAKVSRTGWALGSQVSLTAYHADTQAAYQALDRAFGELNRLEDVMSLYRPDSQLRRLNRDGVLDHPDPWLVGLLEQAQELSASTGGVFDVTVQPLWTLYSVHAKAGTEPTEEEIRRTLALVDWRQVEVSPARIRILREGTEVTLNGIAQGLAADVVGGVLREAGIEHALVDTGEIGTHGRPARREAWSIGIKHPRRQGDFLALASLQGRCLATSGDYETRFSADFRSHHLLDPRTGRSPAEFSSVSVVAPTATQADALSTAVFLLGLDAGRRLIEATPGTDALFVRKSGEIIRTSGFPVIG